MPRVRKRDLIKIFFRSFFSQAVFNQERMLGMGFCFALVPIAKRLYFKNKEKCTDFFLRHMEFFNSHPFLITYALGAVANLEQQAILKRWDSLRPIDVFKKRVIGPLGALGDTFFWKYYLPACALIGVTFAWYFGIIGSFVFLILFNVGHLFIRIRGLIQGFLKGFDIIRDLSMRGTRKYFQVLEKVYALVSAGAVLAILYSFKREDFEKTSVVVFIGAAVFSFFVNRNNKLSVEMQQVIVILSSIVVGLIAIG